MPNPHQESNSGNPVGHVLAAERLVVRPKLIPVPHFGVVVFESRHGPGFVGELKNDFSKFLLLIAGHARWESRRLVMNVGPDTLVHVPRDLPHRQQDLPNDPVILYAIHYRPDVLPSFLAQELLQRGILQWNLSDFAPSFKRDVRSGFQEMLFEQNSRTDGWEWILCARTVELAVRALRLSLRVAEQNHPVFIKGKDSSERVIAYALRLKSQFYRQETLDDAAASTCLSRRRFTELFRETMGQSWKAYLRDLRLQHGKTLLLETEKTVTAVAFECGFEDLSNFHHVFKEALGCSPQAFRQRRKFDGESGRVNSP